MPGTTTFVELIRISVIPSELLLEPKTEALAKKDLVTRFCVVSVGRSRMMLPVTSSLTESVVLLEGFVATLY